MGNLATLQPKPFTSENQPVNKGRPKGSRNRSTILREILAMEQKRKNPITKKDEEAELERHLEYSIVNRALKGDVTAYKEIKDSVYGKIKDEVRIETISDEEMFLILFHRILEKHKDLTEEEVIGGLKRQERFKDIDESKLLKD